MNNINYRLTTDTKFIYGIAAVAVLLAIVSVYFTYDFKERLMDSYEREKKLISITDSLIQRQQRVRAAQPSIPQMNQAEYKKLKSLGLDEPVKELVSNLQSRRDLIPYEGKLGGTMAFYAPDNIFIMNDKWAFAYFEDGHISGNMLLRFEIPEKGEVHWELLDAYKH